MVFVVGGLTTNILPTDEATLPTFTCSASSNHEIIIHKMTKYCSTMNYTVVVNEQNIISSGGCVIDEQFRRGVHGSVPFCTHVFAACVFVSVTLNLLNLHHHSLFDCE